MTAKAITQIVTFDDLVLYIWLDVAVTVAVGC